MKITVKKILIVYGSIGLGHKIISENIAAELAKKPGVELRLLDLLDMYRGRLVRDFSHFYKWMVDSAPWLWGFFYTNKFFQIITLPLRIPFAGLKIQKFRDHVNREKPDLILTCHPNATGLVAYLKKTGEYTGPVVTSFSDFHFQPYWVYPFVDRYLVMTPEQKQEVQKRGFAAEQVVVTGLPVHPDFKRQFDEGEIFKKFGLSRTKPLVLVMGGSQGWGIRQENIAALLSVKYDIQIVVVTGKNIAFKEQVDQLAKISDTPIQSFVSWSSEDIAKLFSVAKILVTKPGGLTCAQALEKALPMILINPLPAMEEMNLEYLTSHGAGVYAKNSRELRTWTERLLVDKKYYQEIRDRQKQIASPKAAEIAAKSIIDMLDSK